MHASPRPCRRPAARRRSHRSRTTCARRCRRPTASTHSTTPPARPNKRPPIWPTPKPSTCSRARSRYCPKTTSAGGSSRSNGRWHTRPCGTPWPTLPAPRRGPTPSPFTRPQQRSKGDLLRGDVPDDLVDVDHRMATDAIRVLAHTIGARCAVHAEALDRPLLVATDVTVLPLDVREVLNPGRLRSRSHLLHVLLANQPEITLDQIPRHATPPRRKRMALILRPTAQSGSR